MDSDDTVDGVAESAGGTSASVQPAVTSGSEADAVSELPGSAPTPTPAAPRATGPVPGPPAVPGAGPVPGPPAAPAAPHSLAATTARLASLDDAELGDHPGIYQEIHRDLQSALADIDSA